MGSNDGNGWKSGKDEARHERTEHGGALRRL
jgi:hypothetical protein